MKTPAARRTAALAAACVLFLSLPSCGGGCPFGLLAVRSFPGEVACCGATARHDFQAADDAELDVTSLQAGQSGRVDAFVTRADCDRLFDGAYPPAAGTAPRCPVIVGPVAPGSVSARVKVGAGAYRLHLLALSSNTASSVYAVDVMLWGENCTGGVF